MFDLNSPIANYASFLKNYTNDVFYGVTCSGKFFTLPPENSVSNPIQDASIINNGGGVSSQYSGIFVLTCGKHSNTLMYPQGIDGRWCKSPIDNEPTYVEELNCVLFASEKERYDVYEKYGDASKLIKSFAANTVPLINSSYIAVTCLNRDKQFWMVHDRTIDPLPIETDLTTKDLKTRYGIYDEQLETHYIFIVNTIIRSSGKSRQTKDTKTSTEIKRVEKSSVKRGQPIIFANIGIVLFEDSDAGNEFLDKYGILSNYMIKTALDATHHIHDEEIEHLNDKAVKDKRGIVETYGIIGGSSAIGILMENVIKCGMDDDKDAGKKAGKTLVVGLAAIASVVGVYKLYRWWEKKKEDDRGKK